MDFSSSSLNSCLDSDPSPEELIFSRITKHNMRRKAVIVTNAILDFNFSASPVGVEPCVVHLMLENTGTVSTDWWASVYLIWCDVICWIHSATSRQDEKGQFSHLGSTSIIVSHWIYHMFPLGVGKLLPSKTHTSPEQRVHSDNYCVVALRIIAHTKAHTFECAYAIWYALIFRSTQNRTVMQYTWQGDVDYSHHAMRKWASPSLSLVVLYM